MPIKVQCPGCSARLKIPDAAAGKRVKCPKCQTPISIPDQEVAGSDYVNVPVPKAKVKKSAAPSANEDDENDDDERPRKRSRENADGVRTARNYQAANKKKSSVPPALLAGAIAVGVIVLGGIGFAIYRVAFHESGKPIAEQAKNNPGKPPLPAATPSSPTVVPTSPTPPTTPDKTAPKPETKRPSQLATSTGMEKPPDFTMTALELTNDFELGPKDALAKYEGKVIRITGVLLGSSPDPITEDYAILRGGKEVHFVHGIPADGDKLPQGMTRVNRLVTIQGVCRGIQNTFDAIDITECVFIKN